MTTDRRLIGRWFRVVWRGSGGALALILTLSVGSAVLLALFPWLWQYLIDEVRGTADPVRIEELAFGMLGVGVAHFLLYVVLQGVRSIVNARIQWRARERLFAHISQLAPSFFRRWRSGDLVTRLTDDAGEKISWFLCSGIFRTYEAVLIVIACVIAMLTIDVSLTFWVILPLPLLILAQAAAQNRLAKRYARVQKAISGINDELTTTFSGVRIVQACGLEDASHDRFGAKAAEQRDAEVQTAYIQRAIQLMYGYGWQAAIIALLLAGGMAVLDDQLTLGQFMSFEGFVMTLIWPMFDVGNFVSRWKQTAVALVRLDELMDEVPPQRVTDGADLQEPSLALTDARVCADDGTVLLDDVSMELEPGQTAAVVGSVGSGKSTLMKLLAGSRPLASGTYTLGSESIDRVYTDARRLAVAFVPQDPVVLSTTIRDNILLGREVSSDKLQLALQVSRLSQDLAAFPNGLETKVGERGLTLSGGQQQRVALARALVGAPQILLLDDATAALDADTEAAFWEQLRLHHRDVTAVVVTHRLGTIERADQVIVLDGGRVAQTGRHAELIASEGTYRTVYGGLSAQARVEGAQG